MVGNTAVFVTDARQRYIADYLPGAVQTYDWKQKYDAAEAGRLLESCSQIVLPTPVAKLEKNKKVSDFLKEELTKKESKGKILFGGAFTEGWKSFLQRGEIAYSDLMQDETVAVKNADVTAEATVAEILKYSDYSIRGQKIIVTGYGRCGRALANLLHAMGAKVTVLARNVKVRKLAREEGHVAVDFSYGPEEVYGARTIVNTVPATVLKEPMIKEMHPDTIILDIASRPGGVDLAAAETYGISVIPALGLPGIYTTRSSAKILAEAIRGYAGTDQDRKEERSWIFQIVI